ncbi:MAG: Maf family protein [Actinomycetaceae bacterium]|nr:Maf family protein [Actinomycetaceae bacterium]
MRFILGSQSPARRKTLENAGISPEVIVADIAEDEVLATVSHLDFPAQVTQLARAKAHAILPSVGGGDAVLVTCDSMLEFAGKLVGKPHSAELAVARWQKMRGQSALLHTGHHLVYQADGKQVSTTACATTKVFFATLSDAEIADYVATGEPLEVAGAFTVDGLGGAFVERIEGDYHSVVGISLPLLRQMFSKVGGYWPHLWNASQSN